MIEDKTICHKITQCFEILEHATKTKHLDLPRFTKLLHEMRQDAQNMENNLKWRKELMVEKGIEKEYKEKKKTRGIAPGTNTVANTPHKFIKDQPLYHVKVTKDNEVMYETDSYAGVFAAVERFDDIDKDGMITGQSQQFYYGHPLLIFYAYDQIGKGMEDYKIPMMQAFMEYMSKRNDIVDPKLKAILKKAANIK